MEQRWKTWLSVTLGDQRETLALFGRRPERLDADALGGKQTFHRAVETVLAHAAGIRMLGEDGWRVGTARIWRDVAPLGTERGEQIEEYSLGFCLGGQLVKAASRGFSNEAPFRPS